MKGIAHWRPPILGSRTPEQVFDVLRDFLASCPDETMKSLPAQCQVPQGISSHDEVTHWAVELARSELLFSGSAEATNLLWELSAVFGQATARLHQLARTAPRD